MKKFYRCGEGCGRDGKIYEVIDEICKPRGEARDFGDEICGLIGMVYDRIRERSCGAKAAGGDV